jgi:hypothetical protein
MEQELAFKKIFLEIVFPLLFMLAGLACFLEGLSNRPWIRNDSRTKFWIALLGEKGTTMMIKFFGLVIMIIGALMLLGIMPLSK